MSEEYKILVCGGRNFKDYQSLERVLDEFNKRFDNIAIIHGGARGADDLAGYWAKLNDKKEKVYCANWDKHGKSAGVIRNNTMLKDSDPNVVICFPGGKGTEHMTSTASTRGYTTLQIFIGIKYPSIKTIRIKDLITERYINLKI